MKSLTRSNSELRTALQEGIVHQSGGVDRRTLFRQAASLAFSSACIGALEGCGDEGTQAQGPQTSLPTPSPTSSSIVEEPPTSVFERVEFSSSIDPLLFPRMTMTLAYNKQKAMRDGPLPLLFLGHGTNQTGSDFPVGVIQRFVDRGFFVAIPTMRRNLGATDYESSGRDSQGRMTIDVIDAMRLLRSKYSHLIAMNNRTYSGYSGSEAYSLAMKAPWAFNLIVAHFAIPEYEAHVAFGGTVQMAARTLGGYASRNAIVGVPMNRRSGFLMVAWDMGDSHVNPISQQLLVDALKRGNVTPLSVHRTQPGDLVRVMHRLPQANEDDFAGIEKLWSSAAISNKYMLDVVPVSDKGYYIPGYLWLGDPLSADSVFILLGKGEAAGQQNAAYLDYDLMAGTFTITPLNGAVTVAIEWRGISVTREISGRSEIKL